MKKQKGMLGSSDPFFSENAPLDTPFLTEAEVYTDESGKYWGNSGAGVIFYCKKTGRILLARRSLAVNEPHTWCGIGGKIDQEETPQQAAKREVQEEARVIGSYKLKLFYIYKDEDFKFYNFIVTVNKEFKPKITSEIDKFIWCDYSDIKSLPKPLHFGFKYLYSNLKKIIKAIEEKD